MRDAIEKFLAVIGLLVLIGGCALIVLGLERQSGIPQQKCDARVQMCGYGLHCDPAKCYVRSKHK